MTRAGIFLLTGLIFAICFPISASAGALDFLDGMAIGAGYNQGSENDANESFVLSFKTRETRWEYGIDFCRSEGTGGVGEDNFMFVWGAWIEEFDRPEWQDYGVFVGAGAGIFLLDDSLIDWPAGPFLVLGWDFSDHAGLEGKVGYFGENNWGTGTLYWYF